MKIIAISQCYWPDEASVPQHLTDLLEYLAKKNHKVTVFTSISNYENPAIKYPKKKVRQKVKIQRIFNTSFSKKTILGRLLNFFTFNLFVFFKLIRIKKESCDIVIGLTVPPLLSYIGIVVARYKGIKFLYWTMDMQPELSIVSGYLKKKSLIALILQKQGDYVFKESDIIITLDKYMKKHIYNRTGRKDNVFEIPVWPVANKIYTGKRLENPFRLENKFGNKIVVMYSGNHSLVHPLDVLIEACIKLKDDKRFLFVHIGGGVRLKHIEKNKSKYKLKNVITLPFQPRNKIHLSLGSSDIQVVILGEGCVGYTHPNKIYGAMFAGKPILYIGPKKSHITDILDNCYGNISVENNNSELLIEKLISFSQKSEQERINIGKNNREYIQKKVPPELLKRKISDKIENTIL